MIKVIFLCLTLIVKFTLQNDHNDLIQTVLSNFILSRHVHTITAATCWSMEVNKQLLKKLSAVDISLTFGLFKYPVHATWYRHGFIVDISCDSSLDFMQEISTKDRIFNLQNDWVFLNSKTKSNSNHSSTIASDVFKTYLDTYYILPDSEVFLFQEIENNIWEIWSGFRASKFDVMRVFKIGTASKVHTEIDNFMKEKTDFRGVELKTTTVIYNPNHFKGFNSSISIGLDIYTLMHYPMITTLAYQLNFKFKMDQTYDNGWSYGNGSFSGLVGILQREESDFGATGSLMRRDRMAVIDYTIGTVKFESNVIFKQPKLSSITNIHIKPFSLDVWLVIMFTLIVFVLIIIFLNKIKANQSQLQLDSLDVVELVHGAICQQGTMVDFKRAPTRVVVFVLFLTTVFLFNAYSATIVSLFQLTTSIKSVNDMIKEESLSMSMQNDNFIFTYFNETTDPAIRKLYDIKVRPFKKKETYTDPSFGIERIRKDFHAFMGDKMTVYSIINRKWREDEKCGLTEIQLFKLPMLCIAVVKKSGHKDVIKQKLIQQQEVGIRSRIVRHWTSPKPTCDSAKISKQYVSVSFKDIFPTFKLFGYGLLISFAVFILEVAYDAYANYVNNKKKAHKIKVKFIRIKINGP